MGLRLATTRWLARTASASPHLLLIETPGAWRTRVAIEQEIVRRGWQVAHSPADADVLVVCGTGGADEAAAVEAVWEQLPGPRARADVPDRGAGLVSAALDAAIDLLLDEAAQRHDAENRGQQSADEDHAGHEGMDHPDMGHEGMDHGAMDHGNMDMSGPGGIALGSGGPDRDGLAMDVLHLPLGPVLSYWPAGLVLTLALQGDVVTAVSVDRTPDPGDLPGHGGQDPAEIVRAPGRRELAAWRCDAAASVLSLAGAGQAAGHARRARDQLLDPAVEEATAVAGVEDLQLRLRHSWTLRWSVRDLAPSAGAGRLQGDVHARLLRLVDLAAEEAGASDLAERDVDPFDVGQVLSDLLTGSEVATVRLAVASVMGLQTPAGSLVEENR